jgi:uncharacterized protein (TIGR03437 family)
MTTIKLFKLSILCIAGLLMIGYGLGGQRADANSFGPPTGHTGAPGESNCTACHFGNALNSGGGTFAITGVPTNYTSGQEVTVTVTLTQTGRALYGFQLTAIDDTGRQAGTIAATDATRTQLVTDTISGATRQYLEHTSSGTSPSGTNQGSWAFRWTAPTTNVGRITFYAAGNAANGNFQQTGDFIYTTTAVTNPASSAFASVSAASYTGEVAAEGIAAGFGSGLATQTVAATDADPNTPGIQLPTTLGGATMRVRDSQGTERSAPLFFVSPNQINYLIPSGTAPGAANVTVTNSNGFTATGNLQVAAVAPSLFAANANGQGVAAALVLRVKGDGAQSFEQVARFDQAQNRFVPEPIDLGPETDQVFLILFGTGIRFRSSLAAATCQIGGTSSEVLFAGAQGGFVGLDQVNVRLARSLATRGDVNIMLTVDSKPANTVMVNIK